ncbi:hypothetical protein EMIHUDRAFT_249649 [Emiliania huxleyi CCMP1516]|uniref:SMP-30/Gluconolactonase/LRE-like region domain-containing protein n=2 Tax=Emiliania huxleyi TaxID=2903 RepID=A0A0D3I6G0_EMIH1|nr:hypothetical protein EMIHUDRAFT_249649 [Emiliania huxleyi CCMP1516]EOD06845.1 hypothetical protein EMIHUDRAFT_249649 [Emiliania huxleyi CCMP1516]|eukprot:XP_005759274.1 hypothetical protein EMIHUDRAFT_249649 [Emiliania huxleyi CCMP1516]
MAWATAQFYIPSGIAISLDGGALFVADLANHKIRRVEVATGEVTTVAGSGTRGSADGVGDAAQFNGPAGIAISSDGSTLLVSSGDGFRQVCVAAPPPPPSFAPIFVPPSSLAADLAKTWGDKTLPEGKVTFLVGDDLERIEHVSKNGPFIKHEEGGRAQRALDLRELAQMYQVPRLELLCAQALKESVAPATAVPLLEAAHTRSGGVEQLRDFGVAKGLLGDALDQVAELKGAMHALRVAES